MANPEPWGNPWKEELCQWLMRIFLQSVPPSYHVQRSVDRTCLDWDCWGNGSPSWQRIPLLQPDVDSEIAYWGTGASLQTGWAKIINIYCGCSSMGMLIWVMLISYCYWIGVVTITQTINHVHMHPPNYSYLCMQLCLWIPPYRLLSEGGYIQNSFFFFFFLNFFFFYIYIFVKEQNKSRI